jgi:WhiB family redox-sensing transcriptional regulator
MWKPAISLNWQKNALCADPLNKRFVQLFYSKDPKEKAEAKNMCFGCPVRKECLQWALEHREIWGVWGGKDEIELRRALSVAYNGEERRRNRPPNCPYCTARPSKLETSIEKLPPGGRWTKAKVVTCTECGFAWRGRSSANAVEAYKADREAKKKEKEAKKKSSTAE